jgi:Zn-dependent M28 family amino/carboxypeptidase
MSFGRAARRLCSPIRCYTVRRVRNIRASIALLPLALNAAFIAASNIIDDHVSFIRVGVPSVDVVDSEYGRMGPGFDSMGEFHHSNADTMDKVSQHSLEIVGRTILLTVELLDKQS